MAINKFSFTLLFILASIIAGLIYLDRSLFTVSDYAQLRELRKTTLDSLPKDEPIKIGVVWPFGTEGEDYFKEGILLALKELNSKKVLDREIEIIFKDNLYDLDISRKISIGFAQDPKIVAVISDDYAKLAIPNSIIYENSAIIMISPAVSEPQFININFNYIFRTTPNNIDIGKRLADLSAMLNFKKVAILSDNSLYAQNLTKIFRKEILGVGSTIVYDSKFQEESKNFRKVLSDLSPLNNSDIDYDAIFVAGDEFEVPLLIKEAREYGIYAPFLAGDFLDTNTILDYGEEMDGTIIATIFNNELLNDKTQDFINRFKQEYKIMPDTWAAQGYDTLMLLAKAIENAKSLDTEKISLSLKYMKNYESIFGTYSMDIDGNVKNRFVYFKRLLHGKFHYIYLN